MILTTQMDRTRYLDWVYIVADALLLLLVMMILQ